MCYRKGLFQRPQPIKVPVHYWSPSLTQKKEKSSMCLNKQKNWLQYDKDNQNNKKKDFYS